MSRFPLVLGAVVSSCHPDRQSPLFGIFPLWKFLSSDRTLAFDIGPNEAWFQSAREYRLLTNEALRTLRSEFPKEELADRLLRAVPEFNGRIVLASDSQHRWMEGRHPQKPWVWFFLDVFRVLDGPPAEAQQAEKEKPKKTKKRNTERGDVRCKLIAALTKHHQYADGSCLNQEPIGNNKLAKAVKVSASTASAFFDEQFEGHENYKALCRDKGKLIAALKLLNDEFAPYHLLGAASSNLAAPEQDDDSD